MHGSDFISCGHRRGAPSGESEIRSRFLDRVPYPSLQVPAALGSLSRSRSRALSPAWDPTVCARVCSLQDGLRLHQVAGGLNRGVIELHGGAGNGCPAPSGVPGERTSLSLKAPSAGCPSPGQTTHRARGSAKAPRARAAEPGSLPHRVRIPWGHRAQIPPAPGEPGKVSRKCEVLPGPAGRSPTPGR